MNGQYSRIYAPASGNRERPAFFIDRDGVLVKETGYLYRPEDLIILDGAIEALQSLHQAAIPVIMVTNQAGIGRGYYSWSDFEVLEETLMSKLREHGAHIDGVWACAAHPNAAGIFRSANHPWRKPNPGMLLEAAQALNIDLSQSWMAGDKLSDVEAGLRAGVKISFHVLTGYGRETRSEVKNAYGTNQRVMYCADLREAVSHAIGIT